MFYSLLLAFVLAFQPPPLDFGVAWDGADARVSWTQPAGVRSACLLRYYGATYPSGICWTNPEAGAVRVELPGGYLRPYYVPAEGDRYALYFDGVMMGSAMLGEAAVYRAALPLILQHTPRRSMAYVPVLRQ